MIDNNRYPTLCSSCKHASTCTFPKDPERPSFYCEEFEIEVTPQMQTGVSEKQHPMIPEISELKGTTQFVGLCCDCENRQNCIFPKPEGGIWHCQEYQ
jgi:hypothetical protein